MRAGRGGSGHEAHTLGGCGLCTRDGRGVGPGPESARPSPACPAGDGALRCAWWRGATPCRYTDAAPGAAVGGGPVATACPALAAAGGGRRQSRPWWVRRQAPRRGGGGLPRSGAARSAAGGTPFGQCQSRDPWKCPYLNPHGLARHRPLASHQPTISLCSGRRQAFGWTPRYGVKGDDERGRGEWVRRCTRRCGGRPRCAAARTRRLRPALWATPWRRRLVRPVSPRWMSGVPCAG